jgi:hypothetical protein
VEKAVSHFSELLALSLLMLGRVLDGKLLPRRSRAKPTYD